MTGVFADSYYFIALLNSKDQYHVAARGASARPSRPIVTTAWVIVEVADALCAMNLRRFASEFHNELPGRSNIEMISPDRIWLDKGWAFYDAHRDKPWSLTDCISFCVMKELGLTEALTGDHHFEQAGFRALFARR